MSSPVWGVGPTYVNERFHTGVRALAYGLGYSLTVIIPSFYAFYQAGLAVHALSVHGARPSRDR